MSARVDDGIDYSAVSSTSAQSPRRTRSEPVIVTKSRKPRENSAVLSGAFSADWLMDQSFAELRYVVDGIIPEGLTMLVAAPKIGKSWMVLGLAVANSNGDPAFGCIPTSAVPVLYLALEDGPRRLQSRLKALGVKTLSPHLEFITDVPKEALLSTIGAYMALHPGENPIVILDTLGKAMPPAVSGETQYDRDYRVLGALKACADNNPGSSVIVVHHTRKTDGADFVDAVSGTQGIAGAADTVLLLKRPRNEKQALLQVTSRDAAEGEYQIETIGTGNWVLSGGSRAASARTAVEAHQTAGVGGRMGDLIRYVNSRPNQEVRAKDVAAELEVDDATARTYLNRAATEGRIERLSRGAFTAVVQPAYMADDFADNDEESA